MMELNSGLTIIDGDRTNLGIKTENVGTITSWESKGRPPKTKDVIRKLKEIPNLQVPTIINAVRNIPDIDNAVVVGSGVEYLTVDEGMVIVPVPDGMVAMVAIVRDEKFAKHIRVALLTGPERFTTDAFEKFIDLLKNDEPKYINFGIYGNAPTEKLEDIPNFPRGPEFYRENIYDRLSTISVQSVTYVNDQFGRNIRGRKTEHCVVASTRDFEGMDFVTVYKEEV